MNARPGNATVGVLQQVASALGVSLAKVVREGAADTPESAAPPLDLPAIGRAIAELLDSVGSKVDAAVGEAVMHAMDQSGGNQSEAARLMAMDRKRFIRRLLK